MLAPAIFLLFLNLATFLPFTSATPQDHEDSRALSKRQASRAPPTKWDEVPVDVRYCKKKNGARCEDQPRIHAWCYNLDSFDQAIVSYQIAWGCCTFYEDLGCKPGTAIFKPCATKDKTAYMAQLEPKLAEKARSFRCCRLEGDAGCTKLIE
ncbi:hypothetical protein BZA77DRAFT_385488 [Pyronema omphalodes]|nr:hypothetical protein BZA77DRAFT_385488 [Pyronema omphalodes]